MKPAAFDYFAPASVEEALDLLAGYGADARPLAGGQSLVPMLALRLARPSVIVDLNRVQALAGLSLEGNELRIGAMTRQAALLSSPVVARHAALLAKALREVGHPPTRARGTIGGSHAHADPAAELPAAMVALAARFVIRGSGGERIVPAQDFFVGLFETSLRDGELLVEIRVPSCPEGGSAFVEVARRKGDFAIASVAAHAIVEKDKCKSVRLVLGGVNAVPVRCTDVETQLIGHKPGKALIETALRAIPAESIDLHSKSAPRDYRRKVAPVLAARALGEVFGLDGLTP